jgi:transposase-like protein
VSLARAGQSVTTTAADLGITATCLYNWVKQDRIDRGETPGVTTKESRELSTARRRIRELEAEVESCGERVRCSAVRRAAQRDPPGDRLPVDAGFSFSNEWNDSLAALSPAAATRPIDPVRRFALSTDRNARERNAPPGRSEPRPSGSADGRDGPARSAEHAS